MPKPKYGIPLTRSEVGQRRALHRWAKEDGKANAERAQAGLRDKFLREVLDEDPDLSEREAQRRADIRYRLHMQELAFRSRTARARRGSDGPNAA